MSVLLRLVSKKPRLFSTAPILRHSFATPLTNIVLNTEIAVAGLHQTPSSKSEIYLQRVLLNAQYLQSILKLSEADAPEMFSPRTALEELVTLNEGTQLKESLVSRVFLTPACQLLGNKLAFQEMAVCLLNNAFESYQPSVTHRLVFLSAVIEDAALKLSVADGGKGMGWLAQKLSTTQAYSTKQNHSGLGLYFVKSTLEREFSGTFRLCSRLNRGTTITLQFPLQNRQPVTVTTAGLEY